MKPAFSVVVTCYQRTDYLKEAISSANAARNYALQAGVSSELVLVADLPSLEGVPTGVVDGATINGRFPRVGDMILRGADASRGKWLVFLDDDDLFMPHKLARLAETLRGYPSANLVHNGWEIFNDARGYTVKKSSEFFRGTRSIPPRGPFLHHSGVDTNASSIAVRRDVLMDDGLREPFERVVAATDVSLVWAALSRVPCGLVNIGEILTLRRAHKKNTDGPLLPLRRRVETQLQMLEGASLTPEARAYARSKHAGLYPGTPSALGAAIRNLDTRLALRWLAERTGREGVW